MVEQSSTIEFSDCNVKNDETIKQTQEWLANGDQVLNQNSSKTIIKRVNALKNLQVETCNIEAKFYEELHALECKYAHLYEPLQEQRRRIVCGDYEPNEEEGTWALDDDEDEEKANKIEEKNTESIDTDLMAKLSLKDKDIDIEKNTKVKGIPDFWLQVFRSTDLISDMIQDHDEPILRFLVDLRLQMHEHKPYGYTLEFHFANNDYFSNSVLTKTYELCTDVDRSDPFSYDGPFIYKCVGCKIDWRSVDKNVTVRLVKKKQKHKNSGSIRIVTKEEKQDSFFNFFETPTKDGMRPSFKTFNKESEKKEPEQTTDDENDENLCEADFEIGHFIKEFIVPRAVLYFTGELIDQASYNEEYDEDDDMNEDDYDDDDDDDDDEENQNISSNKGRRKDPEEIKSSKGLTSKGKRK